MKTISKPDWGRKNGVFEVYRDCMYLYMIMKWRKFKIGERA